MGSERASRGGLLALASLLALVILLGSACSNNNRSFVVVQLRSSAAGEAFADVQKVVVTVSQGSALTNTLTYDTDGITIDFTTDNALSVNFSSQQSGTVTFDVTAIDGKDCSVAHATTVAAIRRGGTAEVTAVLFPHNSCAPRDGGPPPADGSVLPGCDPTGTACGAQTCQVKCSATPPVNECTPAGKGTHGAACTTNADCEPGAQCFKYASATCSASVCLRYCGGQATCGAFDAPDGGIGTRSLCVGPVQCGSLLTAYHTCSFACDPRESAVNGKTTLCPTGLTCLMVGDMDQVDCACPEPSRTGTDGADCAGGAFCAPGYICNMMGGVKKCRAVCRCDASNGVCTAPNDCRAAGRSCNVLTNDVKFGVCL
jgi:hypothetical protein